MDDEKMEPPSLAYEMQEIMRLHGMKGALEVINALLDRELKNEFPDEYVQASGDHQQLAELLKKKEA